MRKSKRTNANHETLSMFCHHYGQPVSPQTLYRQYSKNMTLSNIIEYCTKTSLKARAVNCPAEYLIDITLPCLIQWQSNRFVVLTGFAKDKVFIRDPVGEQQEYPLHEFVWNYSEIALEVTL